MRLGKAGEVRLLRIILTILFTLAAYLPCLMAAYPARRRIPHLARPKQQHLHCPHRPPSPRTALDLRPTAIGKDYLAGGAVFARAPSGTGWQISLYGAFGVLAALHEGVELNLLGMTAGIPLWPPAVKLPGIGTCP